MRLDRYAVVYPHRLHEHQGPFEYPIRCLIVRSHKGSKPQVVCLELSDRSEI